MDAANKFKDSNTRKLKNAPYRKECIAALQQILDNAGLSEIANGTLGVPAFEGALVYSGYTQTNSPVPGDFVILGNQDHAGVYLGNGQMISNASSSGTFSWTDSVANQNATYGGGGPRYYHHGP